MKTKEAVMGKPDSLDVLADDTRALAVRLCDHVKRAEYSAALHEARALLSNASRLHARMSALCDAMDELEARSHSTDA
jgi:hypothetical protein